MLSIAIPTYNYSITQLVQNLIEQTSKLEMPCEILIYEDASENYLLENKKASNHEFVHYLIGKTNVGRTQARQMLASKASYSYILFLDADVYPTKNDFLKKYISVITSKNPLVVCGGIEYQDNSTEGTELRWKFGREREARTAAERNKNPYFIVSSNLLIEKDLFIKTNTTLSHSYGLDNVFSFQLKEKNIVPLHIDNPTFHLGLETNTSFLKKSLLALETLAKKTQEGEIDGNFTRLQKAYKKLKKYYLLGAFSMFVKLYKSKFEKNLLSKKPNLRYFDYYRLYHYGQYLNKS